MQTVQKIYGYLKSPGLHIERFVAVVGLLFGLLFMLIIPPMQGPDESNQFLRVYQISQLNFVADNVRQSRGGIATYLQTFERNVGGNLPKGVVDFTFDAFDGIPQHSDVKMTKADFGRLADYRDGGASEAAAFGNTAAYSPVAYAPQVIAMWLGRLFNATPLVLLYVVRLSGLLVGLALVVWAIRLMPFAKLPLAVVALLPMTIGQFAIVSADSMTIGIGFLAVAAVLHYAFRSGGLNKREIVYVVGLFALLGFIKPSLLPLALVALLLLRNARIGRRTALFVAAGCVLATAVCGLLWNVLVKDQVILGFHMSYPHNDYAAQLSYILHEPWNYVRVLLNTFLTSNLNYVPTSFVGYFGWADTPLPLFAVVAGFVVLALSIFVSSQWESVKLAGWQRWVLIASFVGVALLTATYMYLFCGAPRDPFIVGVQGRYFIPAMAVVVPLGIVGRRILKSSQYQGYARWCLYGSVGLLVVMTFVALSRFYNLPVVL